MPRPLLDRMEMIRLSGYTEEEKIQIAQRYLIPRQLKETGLDENKLTLTDEALRKIISATRARPACANWNARIGRRGSQGRVEVSQKATRTRWSCQAEDLGELLGPEMFIPEQAAKGAAARSRDGTGLDRSGRRRALSRSRRCCPMARASRSPDNSAT